MIEMTELHWSILLVAAVAFEILIMGLERIDSFVLNRFFRVNLLQEKEKTSSKLLISSRLKGKISSKVRLQLIF